MDRERLTITLNKTILQKVDNFIDGTRVRNRSHAIEYLLAKSLNPSLSKAVILAGGPGVKMRPFTFEMPKSLFPVSGKPLLEYTIELLRKYEIKDIVLVISHLGEKIRNHFGNGKKFGVHIEYVVEEKPVGTGGALKKAEKLIHDETFLVLHGDILADINLSDLIAFHKSQGLIATIALTSTIDPSIYGSVKLHGAKIVDFVEKPPKGSTSSLLINTGIYVLEKNVFEYLPKKDSFLLEDIFPSLAKKDNLGGFFFEGKWFDIGTPTSYEYAIKEWRS